MNKSSRNMETLFVSTGLALFALGLGGCRWSSDGASHVPELNGERYTATCECWDACKDNPSDSNVCTLADPFTGAPVPYDLLPHGYSRSGDWCINDEGLNASQIRSGVLSHCTEDAWNESRDQHGGVITRTSGHSLHCEVRGSATRRRDSERNSCSSDLGASPAGLTESSLLVDSSGLVTEPAEPGYTNASVASGMVNTAASKVTVYFDGVPTVLAPTGFASLRQGYCPGSSCAISVEGLRLDVPTFSIDGRAVSEGTLHSFGGWDGDKRANNSYTMYDTSTMTFSGLVDGEQHVEIARSREKIKGVLHLSATSLPAPLTGNGRYATVSGMFTVNERTSVEVSLVIVFERGAPTPLVTSTVQPACGNPPCDGITYDASGSRTWDGGRGARLSFRWVDALGRLVSWGPTLDSNRVTVVPGRASGWPVTLTVQEVIYDPPAPGTEFPTARRVGPYAQVSVGPTYNQLSGVRETGEFGVELFGNVVSRGYFNGDSYEDVVVGSPQDWEPGNSSGGSVQVISGGRPDLRGGGDTTWTLGTPNGQDRFGQNVAVGDFNGDGRQDIAASAPGRFQRAGAVYIRYGSKNGLLTTAPTGAVSELRGTSAPGWIAGGQSFGTSLVAADVNGDGAGDLIVGMPSYNSFRGAIWVYYGKRGVGIVTAAGTAVRVPHQLRMMDIERTHDAAGRWFGSSLAAGDFDHDGIHDIAVSASGLPTGVVTVLYGTGTGLSSSKRFIATGEGGFGAALAAGDFNGDKYSDLAVGAPGDSAVWANGGAVVVYRGTSVTLGSPEWYRQAPADPGGAGCRAGNANDRFGTSLTAARIDGDERDDLVVSAINSQNPGRDQFFVLRTAVSSSLGALFHTPNEHCIPRSAFRPPDSSTPLGPSITTADITHDGRRDIVVGSLYLATGGRIDVVANHPTNGIAPRTYSLAQSVAQRR